MRLKVGEVGTMVGALGYAWKFIHRPESIVDESDSSHSGIVVVGVKRRTRFGLAGAEAAAKKGIFNADMDSFARVSKLKV